MRNALVAAASAALLIGLVGCSSEAPPATEPDAAEVEEVEAAPLEAAPQAAEPDSPEAAYLELIRQYSDRGPEIADATDEQLLAAGKLACEQLAEGKTVFDVRVVDGEQPDAGGYFGLSSAIAGVAEEHLC